MDSESNEDRFYHVHVSPTLFGEWSVVIEWGRNGSGGTVRFTNWPSEAEADKRAAQLANKKVKRGYSYRCPPTFELSVRDDAQQSA